MYSIYVTPSNFGFPLSGRETGIIGSNNQPICLKIIIVKHRASVVCMCIQLVFL